MRKLLLAALLLAGGQLTAATLSFQDRNFAVDLPADWKQIPSPSPQILAAAQSPNGQQRAFIFATQVAEPDRATGARDVMSGIKQSFAGAGMQIDREESAEIENTPFLILDAHSGTTNYIATYVTAAGAEVYAIQLFSSVQGGTEEAGAFSIVQRFRLLAPQPFLVAMKPSASYKMGYLVGRFLAFALIPTIIILAAGAALLFLSKRRRRKISNGNTN